jgi:tetratricopeptide (TPR) repeat protein
MPRRTHIFAVALLLLANCVACVSPAERRWSRTFASAENAEAQNRLQDAERIYQAAVRDAETFGPQDERLGMTLFDLASVQLLEGKYREAEASLLRAKPIFEARYGPDSPETGYFLNSLAVVNRKEGRYPKAEVLHKRALDIWERAGGEDHPLVALALSNLSILYREQGRYAESESLIRQAIAIGEKHVGASTERLSWDIHELAELYRVQGRYGDAEPLYRQSMAMEERDRRPGRFSFASNARGLAEIYVARGEYEKAEALYREALNADEKSFGPDHPDVAEDLEKYAAVLRRMKRDTEAAPLEARAKRIRGSRRPPAEPRPHESCPNLRPRRSSPPSRAHFAPLPGCGPPHPGGVPFRVV